MLLGKGLFILLRNNLLIQPYNLLRWQFSSLDTNQKLYKLIMVLNLHTLKTLNEYILSMYCNQLDIKHQLIRPRTPRHNGKVERSHRNDNEGFYKYLSFYSYDDLIIQMKKYLYRSNRLPMQTLGWLTLVEKRRELQRS